MVIRPSAQSVVSRRGASLVFVLVVATLGFLAAFVLAGSTSAHLSFAQRSSRVVRARLLAEAAVTRAVAELQQDPLYGQAGASITVTFPGDPPGAHGRLTFAEGGGFSSTYNLDSDTSRPGAQGRLVPPHSVHLIGEGECLGVLRRVEAIVTLPPYPYALASSGPIVSDGELLVGSLDESSSSDLVTPESLAPAHLASNHPDPSSISLGPRTTVVGDVRSVGGLELSQGVVIKGQTLAYGEPVALPEIPLESYDPRQGQTGYQQLPSELTEATISGAARADGDLTVYGELTLDQGKLYVDGHLTVRGPLSGRGLIVASQGASLYTGARITGGEAVLLSGGDVLLQGGGPLGSFFQGMVYAEGSFQASDITVVGSFISRGEGAGVRLRNARVLGNPELTSWEPSLSHTFHFAPGPKRNEPAIRIAGPAPGSFAISVRLISDDGQVRIAIDDPRGGPTRTFSSWHPAARQVAVLANDLGRELLAGQGGGGTNLVAAAESLEETLRRLQEQLSDRGEIGFDLNRFLSLSDRLRVTLWREL